ncbi:MAG: hypothetical protein KGI04_01685 [Candidatus Micrarchaeota archaeon]|nr:hypothetical protein [Candidatus Micrarchaeota archaeon]
MSSKERFLFHIEPREFLDRVSFGGNGGPLKQMVRESNGVVAPTDISRMASLENTEDREAGAQIELGAMRFSDLEAVLKSIPNKRGERVYEGSLISAGHMSHNSIFHYRAFANISSLLNLNGLSSLFERFDFSGIANSAASTISYKRGGDGYVALYIPPIVETITKDSVRVPLGNLRRRASENDKLALSDYSGATIIDIGEVVRNWDSILENRKLTSVQVVRDGIHRMFLAHTLGAPQYVISVNGLSAEAPAVPVRKWEVIRTTTGTERIEDRYLGLNPDGWIDEPFVGIDG